MKLRFILLGVSLVVVGALFVYFGLHHLFIFKKTTSQIKAVVTAPSDNTSETRIDEQASITIEVTPIKKVPGAPLQFQISLNTHLGSLDDDLVKQSEAIDEQSNVYKPINWTGSGLGGHHRDGVLTFGVLNLTAQFIELNIKDVGGVPLRKFRWDLK